MKILGLTPRYFPLPQPTSKPIDPSCNSVRKRSTIGHGCRKIRMSLSKTFGIQCLDCKPYTASRRNGMLFDRTLGAHGCVQTAHYSSDGRQTPCVKAGVLPRPAEWRKGNSLRHCVTIASVKTQRLVLNVERSLHSLYYAGLISDIMYQMELRLGTSISWQRQIGSRALKKS